MKVSQKKKDYNHNYEVIKKVTKGANRAGNITIEELQAVQNNANEPSEHLILSSHEKHLIAHYRKKTDLQKAVDLILFTETHN